jgi:thiamine-phosphate diphosphorylase
VFSSTPLLQLRGLTLPHRQLDLPIIALVTDRQVCGGSERLLSVVQQAVSAGVNLVQLREKDVGQHDLLEMARSLREITQGRALLFINGDPTVARLSCADGVQFGEAQARETRQAVAQGLVARSVHDVEGARRAVSDGAHLLVAGPVYETQTHPGQTPAGISLIRDISGAASVPVVGIGGITAATAPDVIAAGASGVAVIREILAAPDPAEAAKQLHAAVTAAWKRRTAPDQEEAKQQ